MEEKYWKNLGSTYDDFKMDRFKLDKPFDITNEEPLVIEKLDWIVKNPLTKENFKEIEKELAEALEILREANNQEIKNYFCEFTKNMAHLNKCEIKDHFPTEEINQLRTLVKETLENPEIHNECPCKKEFDEIKEILKALVIAFGETQKGIVTGISETADEQDETLKPIINAFDKAKEFYHEHEGDINKAIEFSKDKFMQIKELYSKNEQRITNGILRTKEITEKTISYGKTGIRRLVLFIKINLIFIIIFICGMIIQKYALSPRAKKD